jgi:HlyD family secretion protein
MSKSFPLAILLAGSLVGCAAETPQVLGTLEYDRISLPAPSAERIVSVEVREGDRVKAGAVVMTLERTRIAAQTDVVQAQAQQQRDALAELEAGTRSEQVAQARARLAAAQAQARDARAYFARVQPLGQRRLIAAVEVDRARAAADSADANVRNAQASLDELENGTRAERIAQAQSAVRAADAQVASVQAVTLDKLEDRRAARRTYRQPAVQARRPGAAGCAAGDHAGRRCAVCPRLRARADAGEREDRRSRDGAYRRQSRDIRARARDPQRTEFHAVLRADRQGRGTLSYLAEISPGTVATIYRLGACRCGSSSMAKQTAR